MGLRMLGKRDVKGLLAEKARTEVKAKGKRSGAKDRGKKPGKKEIKRRK